MKKKTLVLGASPNTSRYSNKAVNSLKAYGHEVVPVGIRDGEIVGLKIIQGLPEVESVDTITLYVGPDKQSQYYDYITETIHPKRVIFNPGTENPELMNLLNEKGIGYEVACTLVLLSIDNY